MKIVHVCHTYIDGYAYQENELTEAHVKLGHDVTIISSLDYSGCFNFDVNPPLKREKYSCNGCIIVRLPLLYKSNYRFIVYKGLYQTLINEKPDLIYFHEIPYFCYYDIIKYKKKSGCKLVVDFHCDFHNSANTFVSKYFLHKGLYRIILKLIDKYIDKYYAVTPGTIDFICSLYNLNRKKVELLPLGGDLDKIKSASIQKNAYQVRSELGLTIDQKIIVFAGKIDQKKNIVNLIEAFKRIDKEDLVLILIGSIETSYEEKIEKAVYNQNKIFLLGWKTPLEIYSYFLASDLACFPGGQSVIWQQAICCGLPMICCYWPGADYLDSGGNVYFIEDQTIDSIYIALKDILSSSERLKSMAKISNIYGSRRFSYINIGQKIINDIS